MRVTWIARLGVLVRGVTLGLVFLAVAALAPGCIKAWLFARLPEPILPPAVAPVEVGSLSAETCGACHPAIYSEWRGSKMAQAWTDPVFQSDLHANNQLYACRYCHTPLVEQRPEIITGLATLRPIAGKGEPNPLFDAALQAEGVTCVACHLRDGVITGPLDGVQAPHPVHLDPNFASEERCRSCHALGEPPLSDLDRPIEDTYAEWEAWKVATGRSESCADCHMPAVERPVALGGPARKGRAHTFHGAWDDAMVRAGVDIRVEAGAVVLTNRAGHNFPTAEPARAVGVFAEFLRGGEVVGRAERWIERRVKLPRMVDLEDTTLRPGEERRITWEIPAGTDRVKVRVVFDRLRGLPDTREAATEPVELVLWEGEVGVR